MMLIYNVVFEVPKNIHTFAFRVMYERNGSWLYFPGSLGYSNSVGEKRHANCLAQYRGRMKEV